MTRWMVLITVLGGSGDEWTEGALIHKMLKFIKHGDGCNRGTTLRVVLVLEWSGNL